MTVLIVPKACEQDGMLLYGSLLLSLSSSDYPSLFGGACAGIISCEIISSVNGSKAFPTIIYNVCLNLCIIQDALISCYFCEVYFITSIICAAKANMAKTSLNCWLNIVPRLHNYFYKIKQGTWKGFAVGHCISITWSKNSLRTSNYKYIEYNTGVQLGGKHSTYTLVRYNALSVLHNC